jgi:glycosyltransferase involved in cell wall biosynthesis
MSVLHIVPAIFGKHGTVGGAERYALELARHMAEEVPTTLAAFGEESREQQIGRLRVRVFKPRWHVRGQQFNPLAPSLLGEIRSADIVHCHQQHIMTSSLTALLCRLTRRKVVVSDLGGGGWDISGYMSTDRWYKAHLHISEYSRRVFGHADKPWAHVIYGGVDSDRFSTDHSIQKDGTVLFVGRILPHKGIDDLIRAVTPGMRLEIIGKPYDDRYLQDLTALAQGKQVVFRHECDDQALVESYRRARCVVLPSVYRSMYGQESTVPELLGQTLLEGMACGTPAICTDVASMPEIVQPGVTGFIVPPNDAVALRSKLAWFAAHPDEARKMGEAARASVVEKFSWPGVVRRCLSIYRDC